MKLENYKNLQNEYRHSSKTSTTSKTEIFLTLVHGQKPLTNVIKEQSQV